MVFLTAGSAVADSDKTRFIPVEDKGTVTAVPDIASINTGVTARTDKAREALSANNKAMSSLFRYLYKAVIDEKDIRTRNFSVLPYCEHYESKKSQQIAGYKAASQVTVWVRDFKTIGPSVRFCDLCRITPFERRAFSVAKPGKFLDQARQKAVKDAMWRAQLCAGIAGASLAKTLQSQEL